MIESNKNIIDYLQDYHNGKIKKGLDTGLIDLDNHIRFKHGQFTIINGLDNVGKTVLILWYFLVLSVRHNVKWCIYSGENKSGQLVRQLIQFYTGTYLNKMTLAEVFKYEEKISEWFTFIDNSKFYKSTELFELFEKGDYDGCLIDPFTGLNRAFTHEGNYDFLNECRQFCNKTNKSVYVNTHVVSSAARKVYADGHAWSGYAYPPSKSDSEGGQPFGNRCDDFITIHRLLGHPEMKFNSMWYTRKVKDTETGGEVNGIDLPILLEFNKGLGFTINGQNPLTNMVQNDLELSKLEPNTDFDIAPF